MDKSAAAAMGRAPDGMRRRAFLIGGAGAGLCLSLLGAGAARAQPLGGVPYGGKLSFKVLRKGSHIGEHNLRFDQDADGVTIHIDVHIVVKVGPLPVYRHTQTCVERWRGGQVASLDTTTTSTASKQTMTARRASDGVHITSSATADYVASLDALPLTHWNRAIYQGPVFNPENGKMLRETVVGRADDMVRLADGSSIRATRYSVAGDGVEDNFYDTSGVWAGLHARVEDGSYVDYLRV
jgi:hypothetical protein